MIYFGNSTNANTTIEARVNSQNGLVHIAFKDKRVNFTTPQTNSLCKNDRHLASEPDKL